MKRRHPPFLEMTPMSEPKSTASFTGRTRARRTSRAVRAMDIISRLLITTGGIGTIIAVSTVGLFLVWVAAPLFLPAKTEALAPVTAESVSPHEPQRFALNENQTLGWAMYPDGRIQVLDPATGATLDELPPLASPALTAASVSPIDGSASLGFEDGSVRLGEIRFSSMFIDADELPADTMASDAAHQVFTHEGRSGVLSRISESQFRFEYVERHLDDPLEVAAAPIVLVDHSFGSSSKTFCAMTQAGDLFIEQVTERRNILTQQVTRSTSSAEVVYEPPAGRPLPSHLLLSGLGDAVYLAWRDGLLQRYDTRTLSNSALAEQVELLPKGRELTDMEFLLGRATILVGDSAGEVGAWFRINAEDAATPDGSMLVRAHTLAGPKAPVVGMSPSSRSRNVIIGYEDGSVRLYQVTSQKLLADLDIGSAPARLVSIAPKEDGVSTLTSGTIHRWAMDVRHPEASLGALFLPVWYEGYLKPTHHWESSSGTDDFEQKLGLYPLVFGTIKATVYSLLFGVPLALLAAIYTSEFLHPRAKSALKPTIEMMASLPSVVLGFLAALVIAPFVENVVPAVLTLFAALPLTFLLGAYGWQLLPQETMLRLSRWRFLFILLLTPIGVMIAWLFGPVVETVLFAGDIKLWLDGQRGSGIGGWMILFIPLGAIVSGVFLSRVVNPWLRPRTREWSRQQIAVADLLKFAATLLCGLAIAWMLSFILTSLGFDPRGSFVGTYVQRNALIVGFIMGFAIIPIIYTIAEDALSTVPEHLRAASLGAGATRWQTAVRVILPTAMSGLFSAVMIGLGRAVGETMIVLMAAGNTAVLEWNMFNGFRTLSANIAVELPEAVRNSTHYRTLFLAALVLFAMTFVLNTIAESVRLRFRKRAYQL